MNMDSFWAVMDAQLNQLRTAASADDVLRILAKDPSDPDAGFFGGSGGDNTVMGALYEAGWHVTWSEADYHYVMQAPNGDKITYCEGDIYRGDSHPS